MDCCVQGQGQSNVCLSYSFIFLYHWALGKQSRCVYVLLLIAKPSTTKWTYKNWITAFKVKVTMQFENFIDFLCITDLLATKVGVLIYC